MSMRTREPVAMEERRARFLVVFHFARKIVSMWREAEPLTRARMLVAFVVMERYEFIDESHPERLARMKAEMRQIAGELTPEMKGQLAAFLDTIVTTPPQQNGVVVDAERCRKVTAIARKEFQL